MELQRAKHVADTLYHALLPHCRIIHIAGSIRREKSEVGDVELVCLPNEVQAGGGLFDTEPPQMIRSADFIRAAGKLGEKLSGDPRGRMAKYMIKSLYGEIKLDLFMPTESDYFRQLAIRTGSAEWVMRNIAVGWRQVGWVGTEDGLRLASECVNVNEGKLNSDHTRMKAKWKCVVNKPTVPPFWKSELEFFDWLQLEWVEPQQRMI